MTLYHFFTLMGWFERFCPVYTPRGERLHAFSRHARFLGFLYILPNSRFVRRWPKAPPRGALGEYAVSPRSDLRSPASLSAATCTFTQQPFLNHAPITHPTLTHHPSCRIQERFQHNHPTFVILQLQPQNSAAELPRIKVLYTRSAG